MPDVHLVGEISYVSCDASAVSVTWAVVPTNADWVVRQGMNYGESQASIPSEQGSKISLNYPLDMHFQTSALEGWPVFVMEVWDRCHQEVKGFFACGSAFVPMHAGHHRLELPLWRPVSKGVFNSLTEYLLPASVDVARIRELSIYPFLRQELDCEPMGVAVIDLYVVHSGFDQVGVQFANSV